MARPGLETSHTWGLTSSKKGTDSSFSTSDCKYSDTRQRKLSTSSFPQVTLVWRRQRSLPSRGAGQPGMLGQMMGPVLQPVAYLSKQLDEVARGWPTCLRAVVATALMVKEASKLTLGQPPQCIHLTRCKQSWKLKGIGG